MKKFVLFFMACLILTLGGCSDETTSPVSPDDTKPVAQVVPEEVQQLLDTYGLPDDALSPELGLVDPEGFPPDLSDTSWDIYAVTYLWGRLHNYCTDDAAATVWDGTLSANGEIVVYPAASICFENGQDSIVPYTTPYMAEWGSRTDLYDFDGISFLVFYKRGIFYFVLPTLKFETQPFTLELDFGELEHYLAFFEVGGCNAVAVYARRLKPYVCTRGLLSGEWIKDEPFGGSGHFEGLWQDHDGNPIGYYSGRFWINNDSYTGTGEFEGSVSGYVTDEVIATLRGTWWYDDWRMCPMCGEGHGRFEGRIFYLNSPDVANTAHGYMKGEFGWREDYTSVKYPMNGVWYLKCTCLNSSDYTLTD
jgi:hypothetical protein